jgi:hypothetical protein
MARLPEHAVNERSFAMVNMGYDRNISYVVAFHKSSPSKKAIVEARKIDGTKLKTKDAVMPTNLESDPG